jgi:hypothetical protein
LNKGLPLVIQRQKLAVEHVAWSERIEQRGEPFQGVAILGNEPTGEGIGQGPEPIQFDREQERPRRGLPTVNFGR